MTNWLTDARTLASPSIVIILCGNKKDLEDQRQVTHVEASQFAQENGKRTSYLYPSGAVRRRRTPDLFTLSLSLSRDRFDVSGDLGSHQ